MSSEAPISVMRPLVSGMSPSISIMRPPISVMKTPIIGNEEPYISNDESISSAFKLQQNHCRTMLSPLNNSSYKAETSTSCILGNFILKANSATTSDTTTTLLMITE